MNGPFNLRLPYVIELFNVLILSLIDRLVDLGLRMSD